MMAFTINLRNTATRKTDTVEIKVIAFLIVIDIIEIIEMITTTIETTEKTKEIMNAVLVVESDIIVTEATDTIVKAYV